MLRHPAIFIGTRYASLKTRKLLVGFISSLSIIGLSLGVAILITVLSVMNGFDRELQQRILALVPHITVSSARNESRRTADEWEALAARITAHPLVAGTAPQIQEQGMLLASGRSRGVLLNGIDPDAEREVSIIGDFIIAGDYAALQPGSYTILIGTGLAEHLGVTVGDRLPLVSTRVTSTLLGQFPRQRFFTVAGIFRVGSQLDDRLAIVHMEDAQVLYRLGDRLHGLRIQLHDLFRANEVISDLQMEIPGNFLYGSWMRDYGAIYENIRLSKTLVALLLFLLVAVAVFNVVVSLFMVVRDKNGDIAILRAMGAPTAVIRQIFLVQGFIIGLIGTGTGLLLGLLLSWNISDIFSWVEGLLGMNLLSSDVYPINYLPSELRLADTVLVCAVSMLLCLLATIYPAYTAARLDPAEILRHE